jgi:hypothetical protein
VNEFTLTVSVGSFAEVWGWSRSGTISTKSMGLGAAVVQGRLFKGRQVTGEVIPWAVRWYLMLPISYRDLKLMLLNSAFRLTTRRSSLDPGLYNRASEADPAPSAAYNGSLRVDEAYIRVKGRWTDLYRAVGQPLPDDRLSALGQARCGGSEAVLPQGVGPAAHGEPAHDHGGQEPCLSESNRGEGKRRAVVFRVAAPGQVHEQISSFFTHQGSGHGILGG